MVTAPVNQHWCERMWGTTETTRRLKHVVQPRYVTRSSRILGREAGHQRSAHTRAKNGSGAANELPPAGGAQRLAFAPYPAAALFWRSLRLDPVQAMFRLCATSAVRATGFDGFSSFALNREIIGRPMLTLYRFAKSPQAPWRSGVVAAILLSVAAVTSGGRAQMPAQDAGAAGAWQKLLKLRTTASVMHTTAHPDDEHGGVLAMLSRGQGARVSLLTLTRGESGDNAIGPELFDGLGLIRTEELLVADRYYGVDRQYFSDGGRLRILEAARRGAGEVGQGKRPPRRRRHHPHRAAVGADRAVPGQRARRPRQPLSGRPDHAGGVQAGGRPEVFPEQIAAGLRPWQPLKLYMGGVRENEDWTIRVDAGEYDPVLGDSYQIVRAARPELPAIAERRPLQPAARARRCRTTSVCSRSSTLRQRRRRFFDGIDTTLARHVSRAAQDGAGRRRRRCLTAIDREITGGVSARSSSTDPSAAAARTRTRARGDARSASQQLGADPDVGFMLALKEQQFADAINTALGISLTAMAQPAGTPEATGPFNPGPPAMAAGRAGTDASRFARSSSTAVRSTISDADGSASSAARHWQSSAGRPIVRGCAAPASAEPAGCQEVHRHAFPRTPLSPGRISRARRSRRRATRSLTKPGDTGPRPRAALEAVVTYEVGGVPVEIRRPVTRLRGQPAVRLRHARALHVVPAIAADADAVDSAIVRSTRSRRRIASQRRGAQQSRGQIRRHADAEGPGRLEGRRRRRSRSRFSRAGERALYTFDVAIPSLENRDYRIEAVATSGGRDYREGYDDDPAPRSRDALSVSRRRRVGARHRRQDRVRA